MKFRRGKINKDEAVRLLKEGKGTDEIGKILGVTGQAVRQFRRKAIEHGMLEGNVKRGKSSLRDNGDITLENLSDIIIDALEARKKLPAVEAELEKYKNGYQNACEALYTERREYGYIH